MSRDAALSGAVQVQDGAFLPDTPEDGVSGPWRLKKEPGSPSGQTGFPLRPCWVGDYAGPSSCSLMINSALPSAFMRASHASKNVCRSSGVVMMMTFCRKASGVSRRGLCVGLPSLYFDDRIGFCGCLPVPVPWWVQTWEHEI